MQAGYGRVTPRIIRELEVIVGVGNVSTRVNELEDFSHDETPLVNPSPPQVIIRPVDTASIAGMMALANRRRIPVTPRGAGSGLSGGCIPVHGGILLSLERMQRIIEIDRDNFVAIVEPGVTLARLHEEAEKRGLHYPLYCGEMTATIGGNVATNAGGMNAVKYGVTRHHVLGLEAVLPDGEIINTGGKYVKSSSGYDLTQLILGSEGTLAVVTRITLKLTVKMASREVLFVPFMDLQNAIDAVPEILRLGVTPIGLEFMERAIIEIIEKYTGKQMPYHQYGAFLLVIMEGESDADILRYFSQVEEICRRHGAVEAMVPGSERAKRRLLDARGKFFHAIKKYAPMEEVDVVVPCAEIARFVRKVKGLSLEHGVPVIVYGHAGDGNVHLHPLCVGMERAEWKSRLSRLLPDIFRAGVSFGGAISGEHGIGLAKKQYLPLQIDAAALGVMRRIKAAFDPHRILNPGKLFD